MCALASNDGKRVLHTEVGILAEAHHHKEFVRRAMQVEVVTIVEIAVAGGDVADGFGCLMDREIIPGRESVIEGLHFLAHAGILSVTNAPS